MGSTYANLLLQAPAQPPAGVLRQMGRRALVGDVGDQRVLVLDPELEQDSPEPLKTLARELSSTCSCLVLGASVRDDDELRLVLYRDGNQEADYTSKRVAVKQAAALARAFDKSPQAVPLWFVLNQRPVVLETNRHSRVLKLLGLPAWLAGSGYRYHLEGEAPSACEDFELEQL